MKIMRGIFRAAGFAAILIALPLLLSCGGGSGAGSSFTGGGIGGTGIVSQGTITQKGSIFVNGVEFQTSGAAITVDGDQNATENDLKIGMVVTVNGTFVNTAGTANGVTYQNDVEGPIDSVMSEQIVVMNQIVHVDSFTTYDPSGTTLGSLQRGDVVEVSGFVIDQNGTLYATWIEKNPGLPEHEIRGYIKFGSLTSTTFQINNLTVNYASVTGASLSEGEYVEVSGRYITGRRILTASSVEPAPEGLGVTDADHAVVEGYVTNVASPTDFTVGSQRVQTSTPSGVAIGNKVEVEGSLVMGTLMAETVSIQ